MPSYEHKKLIEVIELLDELPDDPAAYATWIKAEGHLDLLRNNATKDELIIYGSGNYTSIHTAVVGENSVCPVDQEDLLRWNYNPCSSLASYVYGWERGDVCIEIERGVSGSGTKTLKDAQPLVFKRTFEGWKGEDESYFEILQEYSHLTDIHWRPEQHAYCRFDKQQGDLDPVVSITSKEEMAALVSFKREPLEQYLAVSNSVLVRMFDFTLCRRENFSGWPDGDENVFTESNDFFYRQKIIPGYAAYTRGVQIIRPSRPKAEILSSMEDSSFGREARQYVEFVAHDWRNDLIANISTDPAATTTYFQAGENSLPFELSPAFFRPEVLLKYKGDRNKYTVGERDIHCRNTWMLRRYDVNEAGQIHAYIRYLRNLPYEEQLYWLSFNEQPKAGISKRALEHDLKGEWSTITGPLEDILSIVRRWAESNLTWWKLREEALLERVSTPHTDSRDEWAEEFMNLSKLIVEGFQVKAIRRRLGEMNIAFTNNDEKSLALLEKLLAGQYKSAEPRTLKGLRTVQRIRSKVKGHSGGKEAVELADDALMDHDTYSAHFKSVCRTVAHELKLIERAFS